MRNKHYYDDSDDMIERVRKAREAFEKKIRAFQGVDWPYYTKRIIKGQLKKEDAEAQRQQASSAKQNPESKSAPSVETSTVDTDATSQPITAHQAASWWATHREAPQTKPDGDKPDQPSSGATCNDKKADE